MLSQHLVTSTVPTPPTSKLPTRYGRARYGAKPYGYRPIGLGRPGTMAFDPEA